MNDPLYDREFDALPVPDRPPAMPDAPPKKPDAAKSKAPAGKPGGRPTLGDRLTALSLTDTIGIGIYLGYLASVVLVTAIRPSLAVAAVGVGFLVAVPLGWMMRRTLALWLRKAGRACRAASGWAWTASRPQLATQPAWRATIILLSLASPILFTGARLLVAIRAGRSLVNLGDRQNIAIPSGLAQIALVSLLASLAPAAKGPPSRRGKGPGGRPLDDEGKANARAEAAWGFLVLAAFLGIAAPIFVMDRIVPSCTETVHAIARLRPATSLSLIWSLGVGAFGGYLGAVWLALLLWRAGRNRPGDVGEAAAPSLVGYAMEGERIKP